MADLWNTDLPNLSKINTYFTFIVFYLLFYFLMGRFKKLNFHIKSKIISSNLVYDIVYFFAVFFYIYILFLRGGYNGNSSIPFSTLITSFLIVIPLLKIYFDKK